MKTMRLGWLVLLLALLSLLVLACEEDSDDEGSTDGDEDQGKKDLLDLSCPDVVQVKITGTDLFSGIEYCPSRKTARRVEAVECPEPVLLDNWRCDTDEGSNECNTDEDCTAGANPGFCMGGDESCYCLYPCRKDADCLDGELCPCESYHVEGTSIVLATGSYCVPANCRTDADCPNGECAGTPGLCDCGGDNKVYGFYCRYPEDKCGGAVDCKREEGCDYACAYEETWHCTGTYSCD